MVKVINESIWVEFTGDNTFLVINGAWYGTIDVEKMEFYPDIDPEYRVRIYSCRDAVKGECDPYY